MARLWKCPCIIPFKCRVFKKNFTKVFQMLLCSESCVMCWRATILLRNFEETWTAEQSDTRNQAREEESNVRQVCLLGKSREKWCLLSHMKLSYRMESERIKE
jgi:hypothetical protein